MKSEHKAILIGIALILSGCVASEAVSAWKQVNITNTCSTTNKG